MRRVTSVFHLQEVRPTFWRDLWGKYSEQQLKQPFIIDNRPRTGSNIGAEVVTKAAPDGYTLLWSTSANAINATLYDNLNFQPYATGGTSRQPFRVPNP